MINWDLLKHENERIKRDARIGLKSKRLRRRFENVETEKEIICKKDGKLIKCKIGKDNFKAKEINFRFLEATNIKFNNKELVVKPRTKMRCNISSIKSKKNLKFDIDKRIVSGGDEISCSQ